ncbi:MAG: GntG family PLP-dependent aldolase [Actinomycetota bacterium]
MDITVDLRSDTVTRPTAAMRKAMAEAEVGDDCYGEDPTTHRLEAVFAERVGVEDAIFVPSGTMANQAALRALTTPGDLVVAGARQHVVRFEAGAAARNAGVQFHLVDDDDGTISPEDLTWAIEAGRHHQPAPVAVFVENTHLMAGGAIWPVDRLDAIGARGLPVHLDGARLFHAEVASGTAAARFVAPVTTVSCCLSKALGAPVGSLLGGPADVLDRARLARKRLGGAMRQSGILAAAGIVALDEMVDRLADDHAAARRLADAVVERWPSSRLRPEDVTTNIVIFRHDHPTVLLDHLAAHGVAAGTVAPETMRFVTHVDVDDAGIDRAVEAIASAP